MILGVSLDNYVKIFSTLTKKILGGGTIVKKLESRVLACALYYEPKSELYLGTNNQTCLQYQYIDSNTFQFNCYIATEDKDESINSIKIADNCMYLVCGTSIYMLNLLSQNRPPPIVYS